MEAQAPTNEQIEAQAGRVRKASKRVRDASRDLARESAKLEDLLGVTGAGQAGVGIEAAGEDEQTTAREGEGDERA